MERTPEKNRRRRRARRDREATRGLGDVLHFFISDDEQAEARDRAEAADPPEPEPDDELEFEEDLEPEPAPEPIARLVPALRGARWCIVASPNRVLDGSLAVDIGATLARSGTKTRILASFEPSPLMPQAASVSWETRSELAAGSAALRIELERLPRGNNLLVVLPPQSVAAGLRGLHGDLFDGVLLPVDASSAGLRRALDWLRHAGPGLAGLRIGIVLVGAREDADAALLFRKLIGAALRQLELEVERVGTVFRDPNFDRSLLLGRPLVDLDTDGHASESLESICENLR